MSMLTKRNLLRCTLACALGLSAAHAQALSLDEIRQYLLELRGKISALISQPEQLIIQNNCGPLQLGRGAPIAPKREPNGCWYRLPLQDGQVEFQYSVVKRAIKPTTLQEVVAQAQASAAASVAGKSFTLEAEQVVESMSEEVGRIVWLESAKQMLFVKNDRLYNVHLRGSEASFSYGIDIAKLVTSSAP
jgi:hypothetical protein